MEGYTQITLADAKIVNKFSDEYYEWLVDTCKQLTKRAKQSYAEKYVGKRLFSHWLWLVPISKNHAANIADNDFYDTWWPEQWVQRELQSVLTDTDQQYVLALYNLREFLRKNRLSILSMVRRGDQKDNILLTTNALRSFDEALANIRFIERAEFPISLQQE